MKVLTSLALDGKTVNLLVSSQSALVLVSDVASVVEDQGTELNSTPDEFVSAHVVRELTGKKAVLSVALTEEKDYVVQFKPGLKNHVREAFMLAVFYRKEHIQGSPFLLRFVDQHILSSIHTEKVEAVVDAEKRMNVVLPLKTDGEVEVMVEGPFTVCNADIHHWPGHSVSVNFMPKGAGVYAIHVTMNEEEVENSPYLILADFSFQEARQCYVMEDDQHLFEQMVKFGSEGVTFRVFTENALLDSHDSSEELRVICSGPGTAEVLIKRDPEVLGAESCTVVPSVPGDYRMSVLWKGRHIHQSPLTMKFRHLRTTIACHGLDIHSHSFQVGRPYHFKLNSSNIEGGGLEVQCVPHTAANVSLTAVNESNTLYRCEILPLEAGRSEITVKCLGRDIEGSPFTVEFEDVGDASMCAIVETFRDMNAEGEVGVQISTDGAGPGILEAMVEWMNQDGVITDGNTSITKTRLSDTLHLLQVSPDQSEACRLLVTYNGRPIHGSPFKLVFGEMGRVRAKGDGLVAGQIGEWNSFILQAVGPVPHGEPHISVTYQDGVMATSTVAPVVHTTMTLIMSPKLDMPTSEINPSPASCTEYEVKYFPEVAGKYKMDVGWGLMPVPGSPFLVKCSSASFRVQNPPQKSKLGSTVEFNVQRLHGDVSEVHTGLVMVARSNRGDNIDGTITESIPGSGDKERGTLYRCAFMPLGGGKHIVSIKQNKCHIEGSPFCVRVTVPPKPECVRVYGPGLDNGVVGMKREFTVETAAAGAGMLAMQMRGPSGVSDMWEDLPLLTSPDEENRRTLYASYYPTVPGEHTIEVKWAGTHVPGSPFNVELCPTSKMVVVADVHPSEDITVEMEEDRVKGESKEVHDIHSLNEESEEGKDYECAEAIGSDDEEKGEITFTVTRNTENSLDDEAFHIALTLDGLVDEEDSSAGSNEPTCVHMNLDTTDRVVVIEGGNIGSGGV